jgi:hypothetical protein
MNETLAISANEASRQAAAYQRRMNGGRTIPQVLPLLQKISDEKKVFIYNVGPFQYTRHMGSTGTFTIPACLEGAAVSEPIVIDGIVTEPVPVDEKTMTLMQDEGRYVAEQIIGDGKFLRPEDSLVHRGVFVSDTRPPKKAEIEAATQKLRGFMQGKVSEMNDAYAMGPNKRIEVQTNEHYIAARYLGYTEQECPWLQNTAAPATRKNCEGCGEAYVVGIMKCKSCGYILDKEKYEKNKANFA